MFATAFLTSQQHSEEACSIQFQPTVRKYRSSLVQSLFVEGHDHLCCCDYGTLEVFRAIDKKYHSPEFYREKAIAAQSRRCVRKARAESMRVHRRRMCCWLGRQAQRVLLSSFKDVVEFALLPQPFYCVAEKAGYRITTLL